VTGSHRVPALDGLRGIAILLVIPHNSDTFLAVKNWAFPFAMLAHVGWTGVQLFFVLSGFLITSVLLDSRGSGNYYRTFYARRVLRIFPLYFLILVIFLLLVPHLVQLSPETLATYQQQKWLWIFASNWAQPFQGTVVWFPHFWSLAVEEQFYLVWPFLVALIPLRHLLTTTFVVTALAIGSRVLLFEGALPADAIYMFTTTRMDALALGAAAAVIARNGRAMQFVRHHQGMMAGMALVVAMISAAISHAFDTHDPGTIFIGYSVLAAAAAILVLTLRAGQGSGNWLELGFSQPWLRSCGKYSYAMYVFHLLVVLTIGGEINGLLQATGTFRPILYSLSVILISYALGWISYHYYERHFLALKRYFVPNVTEFAPTNPANRDH